MYRYPVNTSSKHMYTIDKPISNHYVIQAYATRDFSFKLRTASYQLPSHLQVLLGTFVHLIKLLKID